MKRYVVMGTGSVVLAAALVIVCLQMGDGAAISSLGPAKVTHHSLPSEHLDVPPQGVGAPPRRERPPPSFVDLRVKVYGPAARPIPHLPVGLWELLSDRVNKAVAAAKTTRGGDIQWEVPPGHYLIVANPGGRLPFKPGARRLRVLSATEVEFQLSPLDCRLTVFVKEAGSGRGIPGADVHVGAMHGATRTTDETGQAHFDRLPPGPTQVSASMPDSDSEYVVIDSARIVALASRATRTVTCLAERRASLVLRVRATPVVLKALELATTTIQLLPTRSGGRARSVAFRGSEGTVENLIPGRYRALLSVPLEEICSNSEAFCDVRAGKRNVKEISLFACSHAVTGHVVDDRGRPVAGATVAGNASQQSLIWQRRAATDPFGRFRITGLPAGRCRLWVRVRDLEENWAFFAPDEPVFADVPSGNHRLVLTPGAKISGTVRNDRTGRLVRSGSLRVFPGRTTDEELAIPVQKDGRFVVRNLYPGTYELWYSGWKATSEMQLTIERAQRLEGVEVVVR